KQKAKRGYHARKRRNDEPRDFQSTSKLGSMHGTGAAKADHRGAIDVAAALGDAGLHGVGHGLVDDLMDAPCRIEKADAERLGNFQLQCASRRGDIEFQPSTEKI